MYTLGRQQGGRRQVNIWPGFVDALATLLLVIIFVLMVFMVAQFFLAVALSGKDQALARLEGEINELAELLALERTANSELRLNVADLSSQLQNSVAQQDSLTSQLRTVMAERDDLTARLATAEEEAARSRAEAASDRTALEEELARAEDSRGRLEEAIAAMRIDKDRLKAALAAIASQKTDLEEAFKTIEANQAKVEAQLAELAILKSLRDEMIAELLAAEAAIARKDEALSESEQALSASQQALSASRMALSESEKTLAEREAALAQREAALAAAEAGREEALAQLSATRGALSEQEELAAESQIQVALLNRQIFALRQQLARISVLLEASEAANVEQQVMIKNLGQRLNVALASKVQELARYRSDFFGRLREILGDRKDISIVGDRFVFQSEVLFASGSAELGADGQLQLGRLAGALREIAETIPETINWVLRVDGHTDRAPIATYAFPSNWELSTARAISVVKFLISQGIAPEHLAATGFGEFQPLDPGDDLQAFRRNRRIELKLTQR